MGSIDHAHEWLRLSEHYRQMTDGELIAIARDRDQLTEIAQQMLAIELSTRKLKLDFVNPRPTKSALGGAPRLNVETKLSLRERASLQSRADTDHESLSDKNVQGTVDADDPYAEDRELVEILTVWSLSDALQVQRMLDVAGIPFYLGAENATGVEAVTSNFSKGVSVKVMRIGMPWAWQALQYYEPKDVPESEKEHWDEAADVRCPKCRSKDIVFEESVPPGDDASERYKWTCEDCGYKWEDDGVARI